MKRLTQRTFSLADQKRFAQFSGDHNPMHLDALQARRTPAGAPVVHGINLLLWALDSLAAAQQDLPPLSGLSAQFTKFVYLDESVEVILTQLEPTRTQLNISVDGASRSKITVDFDTTAGPCPEWETITLDVVDAPSMPLNLDFEETYGKTGRIPLRSMPEVALSHFPSAVKWLGARRIAAIAASTCLVGMICPGLHSIFGKLSITACIDPNPESFLAFRVTQTDSLFHSIDLEIAGCGLAGTVRSFFRSPPVKQTSMESLKDLVKPTEFAGATALVIGGSRGLGEVAAKIIASGGGHVLLTWRIGKGDAEKVAQEIRSAGGMCATFAYDAGRPAAEQLSALANAPTHAYYFATPTIYRPQAEIFATERLNEFLAIYVHGFWQLFQALRSRQPKLSIFYPSSIFVTKRPKGMAEYAMAKSAGEALCADINASLHPAHVTVDRLPRLPTDQTATINAVQLADPIDVLLPIIRNVQSWPR